MSKVVKSVGRAVSKVVKGVVNAVKKVAKSKFGKILLTAAAVYFGGAALSGMMQGASAGSGFLGTISSGLQGAAQGIGNAWSSLGTAASQAIGGNFANAGSALSSGFQGVNAAQTAGGLMNGMSQAQMLAAQNAGIEGATAMTNQAAATAFPAATAPSATQLALTPAQAAANTAGKGLVSTAMSSPYTAPAAIMGGTQLIGGAMQGYGAQKQQERQEQLDAEARNRYSTNVGTRLWG